MISLLYQALIIHLFILEIPEIVKPNCSLYPYIIKACHVGYTIDSQTFWHVTSYNEGSSVYL